MKRTILSSALALLAVACTEKPGYVITGTVDSAELNGKQMYLYAYGNTEKAIDSATVSSGSFEMKGTQDAKMLVALAPDAKALAKRSSGVNLPYAPVFVLENANYTANVSAEPTIKGTVENDDYNEFQVKLRDILAKGNDDNENQTSEKIANAAIEFINKHPQSLNSAKVLIDLRYQLDESQRREILSKGGAEFSKVAGIDALAEHLKTLEKVAIGKKFTDFGMKDPKDNDVKLSDFVGNGKVVLIDFWASWCPPCRRDMPALVELYKKYKGKNFEIVGVSLDREKTAWEKGIEDLFITWPQMSDLKGWKSEGAALYGVNSIPQTVLMTADGVIAAKNLHGEELEKKIEELLK